jgi:hypothetical protein
MNVPSNYQSLTLGFVGAGRRHSTHSLTMASADGLPGTNSDNDDLRFHVKDGPDDVDGSVSSSGDELVQCAQVLPDYELLERDQERRCS